MKRIVMAGCVLLSSLAYAQEAKVIALSEAEYKEVQSLQAQKKEIEQKLTDVESRIVVHYLLNDPQSPPSTSTHYSEGSYYAQIYGHGPFVPYCGYVLSKKIKDDTTSVEQKSLKEGWCNGFIYSEDYKYIVPKPGTPFSSTIYNSPWNLNIAPANYSVWNEHMQQGGVTP